MTGWRGDPLALNIASYRDQVPKRILAGISRRVHSVRGPRHREALHGLFPAVRVLQINSESRCLGGLSLDPPMIFGLCAAF